MTSSFYTNRHHQYPKDLRNNYPYSPRVNRSSTETMAASSGSSSRSRSRERERSPVREKYAKSGRSHGHGHDDHHHESRRKDSRDKKHRDERDGHSKHRDSNYRNLLVKSPNSVSSTEERTSPNSRRNEEVKYVKFEKKTNTRWQKSSEEYRPDLAESSRSTSPTGMNNYYKENQGWKHREDSKTSEPILNSGLSFVAGGSNKNKKPPTKMEEEFEIDSDEERKRAPKKPKIPASNIPLSGVPKAADPRKRLAQKLGTEEKLNLIIDLDETLLNSAGVDRKFDVRTLKNVPPECIHEIQNEGDSMRVLVVLRPYYDQFLARLSKVYNIFAYSHGRWDYVQKVVDLLDPEKKHIRRDMIFKNTGQVGKTTPKLLSALGIVDHEAHKTVILDDQKYIWEVASKKVLSSKKFIPLKDLMQEEKFLKYMLFTKEEEGGKNFIWSFNHKSDPFGLKLFAEFDMINQKSSQLESLASFLEEIHQEYNLNKLSYSGEHDKLKVEKLVEQRLNKIIHGIRINIVSSSTTRTRMFTDLVQLMGGVVVDMNEAHVIVMDGDTDPDQKQEVLDMLEDSPLASVLTADWLVECFFAMTKVNTKAFKKKSIL